LPALLDGQTRGRAQQAACSIEQAKVHGADMAGRGLPTASGGASQVCGPTFADPQRAVEALREAARGPDFLAACSVPTECAAYVKALGAIYTATPDEAGGGQLAAHACDLLLAAATSVTPLSRAQLFARTVVFLVGSPPG